jgi:SNF2 family DNA or RNA helicase
LIVITKKQLLLLRLQEPSRITTVIPSAKVINWRGTAQFVAVPHRVEETRVLRNLGFNAPSPIKYYYSWPGRHKPFFAQKETADFLTSQGNAFVLNDLGTGKTLASLWAYDFLKSQGCVDRVLVVSSLSTLERAWGDEIFMNFPHLRFHVLHGTRERRLKLLDQDADIYLINHDGIKTTGFLEAMAVRDDINLVIVDEIAQAARNAGADRWKVLNKLCNKQVPRRVWGMTGKPTPNLPTDAWAQCKLVTPSTVPPYFNRFKDAVMRQVGPFTWLPRDNAMQMVHDAMQPAIRFTRDQCVDLPPCIFQTRQVELTSEQKKAYKEMVNTLRAELEAGEVLAVNEAVKVGKLLQIACGVAYGPGGELVDVPSTPRIDAVKEIIEEAEGKVIIFVPYTGALHKIATAITEWLGEGTVGVIQGATPKAQRDETFRSFQQGADLRVLVAQPAAMSHGLTLTAANTIVWFSAITSNEIYEQANGRVTRPGQKNTQFIINIEGSPIEKRIFERLRNKQALQGLLLSLVSSAVPV